MSACERQCACTELPGGSPPTLVPSLRWTRMDCLEMEEGRMGLRGQRQLGAARFSGEQGAARADSSGLDAKLAASAAQPSAALTS